jgi:PAS domain S-box-containing protein
MFLRSGPILRTCSTFAVTVVSGDVNTPVNETFVVTADGTSAFLFDSAPGTPNPTVYLARGATYTFVVNNPLHPLYIKTLHSTGASGQFTDGVTNNGASDGSITFIVPASAPAELEYSCSNHAPMWGKLSIVDRLYRVANVSDVAFNVNGVDNGALTVARGMRVVFLTSTGVHHPFMLKTAHVTGNTALYSVNVTGNNATGDNGVLHWVVSSRAPSLLFYQCYVNLRMWGRITVLDGTTASSQHTCTVPVNATTYRVPWCQHGCSGVVTHIAPGDTLQWFGTDGVAHTVTDATCAVEQGAHSPDHGCTPMLYDLALASNGIAQWTYRICGVYSYYCTVAGHAMTGLVVVGNFTAAELASATALAPSATDNYPWIRAHGAIMFVAFGVLLPFGGFLAVSGRYRVHQVVQPLALLLAAVGFALALVFKEKQGPHFNHVHSYVGIVFLAAALILQPVAVFFGQARKVPAAVAFHRRLGLVLILGTIMNVFLGFVALQALGDPVAPGLRVAYGCWVGFMLLIYALYQPGKSFFRRGGGGAAPAWARDSGVAPTRPPKAVAAASTMVQLQNYLGEGTESFAGFAESDVDHAAAPSTQEDLALIAVLNASPDAIVGADEHGNVLSWSPGAERMFGYTLADIKGQSLQVLMPEAFKHRHQRGVDSHAGDGTGATTRPRNYERIYEVRALRQDGSEFPCEISVSSYTVSGHGRFTGVIRDLGHSSTGGGGGSSRSAPLDLTQAITERLRRQATTLGHTMQAAHGLESAVYATKVEFVKILKTAMRDAKIDRNDVVLETKATRVASALIAECGRDTGRAYFVDLIGVLQRHGLEVTPAGGVKLATSSTSATTTSAETSGHRAWLHLHWPALLWLGLLYSMNIFCFLYNFFKYRCDTAANGGAGWNVYVQVARGGGLMLDLDCVMIVLPMCRRLLGFLRSTPVAKFTPFDGAIEFHKHIAYLILLGTIIHGIAHLINYSTTAAGVAKNLFETNGGLTGFLLLVVMLPIYIGASSAIRRGDESSRRNALTRRVYSHAVFFFTHHFFVLFFVLLIIHGLDLINPHYWMWFLGPGTIYFIERAYREFWTKRQVVKIIKAVTLPGDVTAITLTKPSPTWRARPGQYIFLQIPAISSFEWHPFTLTSSPSDPHVSVMIRKAGDWTGDVHAMFKAHAIDGTCDIAPADLPDARIDGPFGTASEEVFKHSVAVLVGAGIGATPAASVLRHIRDRLKNVTGCVAKSCGCSCDCCAFKLTKLYFVWSNRDTGAFEVRTKRFCLFVVAC